MGASLLLYSVLRQNHVYTQQKCLRLYPYKLKASELNVRRLYFLGEYSKFIWSASPLKIHSVQQTYIKSCLGAQFFYSGEMIVILIIKHIIRIQSESMHQFILAYSILEKEIQHTVTIGWQLKFVRSVLRGCQP